MSDAEEQEHITRMMRHTIRGNVFSELLTEHPYAIACDLCLHNPEFNGEDPVKWEPFIKKAQEELRGAKQ